MVTLTEMDFSFKRLWKNRAFEPLAWAAILWFGLYYIYYLVLSDEPVIKYDDALVIRVMAGIHGISDYIREVKSGLILDRQPVRDFVTWINYELLRHFDWSTFYLTNILIWFFTIFGLRKLATLIFQKWSIAQVWLFTFFVAFNPLYVSSVAWLTARKHGLAACFTVWATYYFLKWRRSDYVGFKPWICLLVCYCLAVFSQPIVTLWPIWVMAIMMVDRKLKKTPSLIPLFAVMFFALWVNYSYYSGPLYFQSNGVTKFSSSYQKEGVFQLFALGRYLFQCLIPGWTSAVAYDEINIKNLIGFLMFPPVIYVTIKALGLRFAAAGWSFFFLMLVIVVAKMTNIFGMDTYLLSASFALYLMFFQTAHRFRPASPIARNGFVFCVALLIGGFVIKSKRDVSTWDSTLSVFRHGYYTEGGWYAADGFIGLLGEAGRAREAVWIAQDLLSQYPNDLYAQGFLAYAITQDPSLSKEKQIEEIFKYKFFSPIALHILSRLQFEIGNYKNSQHLIFEILKSPQRMQVMSQRFEEIAADVYISCRLAKETDCETKVQEIKKVAPPGQWSDSLFKIKKEEKLKQWEKGLLNP